MTAAPTIGSGMVWRRHGRPWRALAALVLVFWTSFLLLNYLQSCCEVLSWMIPHQHSHLHSTAAGHGVGGHAHGPQHSIADDHKHCTSSADVDTTLPFFLTSSVPQADLTFWYAGLVLLVVYSLVPILRAYPVDDHERGPPERVYLTTLRLRI